MLAAAEARNRQIVAAAQPSTAVRAIDDVVAATDIAFRIGSRIRYRYAYMDRVVQAALKLLREKSPVGSGKDKHAGLYRDSHLVFIEGHIVKDASTWRPGQQINISNPVPYARKIEAGRIKMNVAPHVYEDAAQILAARFVETVRVQFVFMPVRIGGVGDWAQITQMQRDNRRMSVRARRDWLARQPALQITAR